MNFVTRKHIDRRTLLRGIGAAIALPALDAMFPALASSPKPPRRLAVVYVPNGIIMKDWKVATTGQDFAFTRILKPLEPFRRDITVLSGLANHAAEKGQGGGHAKATGSFLSGAAPKYTAGPDVHAGMTFDQLVAQHWGAETRVPSLQIGCEDSRMVGNCDTGSSCAYTNTLVVEKRGYAARGGGESAVGLRAAVRDRRPEPSCRGPRPPGALPQEHSRSRPAKTRSA